MHIQIVNFNLKNLSREGYETMCKELAPAFIAVPGLISKTWLSDPDSNTYGGVYFWRDRAAMLAFAKSKLFNAVASHPILANLSSRDFETLEEPGKTTRGFGDKAA